jgi:hypothetical protein
MENPDVKRRKARLDSSRTVSENLSHYLPISTIASFTSSCCMRGCM